ncbi:phosphopantetheine-binding protein [Pendulispora rubella]|uniref:Phosphopantetheine-binding protein n=1 Tax=Pendulispora rubella TaxID=2741070 RepID=A0ABZ2LLV9_9BACT
MTVDGVVDIFRKILEVDDVQVDSDFFVLGGDSLLATRVLSAIDRQFGVELTFADLMSAPSPIGLSKCIASAAG